MPRPAPSVHNVPLPQSFTGKKSQILTAISVPQETYTDKSPKGSIDAPIVDLIEELNAIKGIVTTSSCSGRVAVFVEGPRQLGRGGEGKAMEHEKDGKDEEEVDSDGGDGDGKAGREVPAMTGTPAGKGGGRWLYVSHEPVDIPLPVPPGFFTKLCGLSDPAASPSPHQTLSTSTSTSALTPHSKPQPFPRLIKLSFSPLILHILCATLSHAKPLLTAAINAGFRESGVQSLKVLNDQDAGVMVGVRTAGLGFETVVGVVQGSGSDEEVYERIVDESYLELMFGVVNERFGWNEGRKERLREEIRRGFGLDMKVGKEWEDSDARRRRKREEGLKRRMEKGTEQAVSKEKVAVLNGMGEDSKKMDVGVNSMFDDFLIDST